MGKTITFVDRAERKYQLLIDGGGTALDGGSVTFETQEDNDADMFKPVRCQTGTFRYIGTNDHDAWLSLIPSDAIDKRVVLQRYIGTSWVTMWQGYIQPQVFENEYPGLGTVEHDFAVQCPLSVLDTVDIDPNPNATPESSRIINNYPTITFGQLLQNFVFNRVTSTGTANKNTRISYYYIQGTTAVTSDRLGLKVMWANFLDVDSNNNVVCKYTCKQVLEEFCKFFGYTCRMHGDCVYFTQPTGNNVGFSRYSNLTGSPDSFPRSTFNITDAMLCDTDDHEEIHPGIGKATVKSDINPLDNLVEIPYDELYDQYNIGIPSSPIIMRSVDWYEHNVYNQIREPDANGGSLSYENDTVSLTCYMANKPGIDTGAGDAKKYCRFFVYDDNEVGGDLTTQEIPDSKEAFSWRKCIELFHSYTYSGSNTQTMFTISSKQVFVISDGFLYINFKCHQVSAWVTESENFFYPNRENPTEVKTYCYAKAKLRIGTKYWNGSAWVENSPNTTFDLPFTSGGAKSNRSSYGGISAPQYSGYGIPVYDTMRGDMEFSIEDVPSYQVARLSFPEDPWKDINGFLPLMDFEIGFVRGTIEDTQHRGNEYTSNGGKFRDEVNVDLIWASDVEYGQGNYKRHMPAGLGYILNGSTEKPQEKIWSMNWTTGNPDVIPEQYLSQLIANYGQTTHRLLQLNLRSSVLGDVTPMVNTSGLESGVTMFPLAISHNWRDDITTLTLMQI